MADAGAGNGPWASKAYEPIVLPAIGVGGVFVSVEAGLTGSEEDLAGSDRRLRRGSSWLMDILPFRNGTIKETIWRITDSYGNPGTDVQAEQKGASVDANAIKLKQNVIPSQFANWRGNPLNRRRLPHQRARWFAMTANLMALAVAAPLFV